MNELQVNVRSVAYLISGAHTDPTFAVLGEPVLCAIEGGTATFSVVSRPDGGAADFDADGAIVPDACGVWTCSASTGATFRLAVGVPALLDWPGIVRPSIGPNRSRPRPMRDRLATMHAVVRDSANASRLALLGDPGAALGGVTLALYGA